MKIPFLIDTDTASDDAVALTMALRSPEISSAGHHDGCGKCRRRTGSTERPLHGGALWCRRARFVDIATDSELTRGMTVVDRLNVARNERYCATWAASLAAGHQVEVAWTIDNARWKEALYTALR